jgi:GNAT superfamily N-acetyltransferase
MVELSTRERVDSFWSGSLGVDVDDLHTPGIRLRPNASAHEWWRGIYVLAFDDAVSVFAPPDMTDQVSAGLTGQDAESALEPKTWHEMLGSAVRLAFGPVIHHYRDSSEGLEEHANGRRINPRDAESLARLRAAIAPEEWLSAGFTAQPAMLFGIFEGDRMVAAANLTAGPDAATDVGIVIHPDARGKGYAVQIAAAAARQALLMHGVARFRALATSQATLAIAKKLAFDEYGRNTAVYLKEPPDDSRS